MMPARTAAVRYDLSLSGVDVDHGNSEGREPKDREVISEPFRIADLHGGRWSTGYTPCHR